MNYYNENDPKAAAWIRELIKGKYIPDGTVDTRSIAEVQPVDLLGYAQCHFFAGIGGWPYALGLAGWPSGRPVWTGSCPCQPFSAAGLQLGTADPRHLWPQLARLIAAVRPARVFGEQVASAAGRLWLARVSTDLEDLGYDTAAADLCAAGVGAPHIRQRLYWVAYAQHDGRRPDEPGRRQEERETDGRPGGLADALGERGRGGPAGSRDAVTARSIAEASRHGHWSAFDLLQCTDGKARRVEPGTFPLAHGVPGRVGLLRGYGNAIVPQLAAEFIQAAEEALA